MYVGHNRFLTQGGQCPRDDH